METRLSFRVAEVATLTGLPTSTIYALARRGEIQTVRVGRVLLVRREELERLLGVSTPASNPNHPTPSRLAREILRGLSGGEDRR